MLMQQNCKRNNPWCSSLNVYYLMIVRLCWVDCWIIVHWIGKSLLSRYSSILPISSLQFLIRIDFLIWSNWDRSESFWGWFHTLPPMRPISILGRSLPSCSRYRFASPGPIPIVTISCSMNFRHLFNHIPVGMTCYDIPRQLSSSHVPPITSPISSSPSTSTSTSSTTSSSSSSSSSSLPSQIFDDAFDNYLDSLREGAYDDLSSSSLFSPDDNNLPPPRNIPHTLRTISPGQRQFIEAHLDSIIDKVDRIVEDQQQFSQVMGIG